MNKAQSQSECSMNHVERHIYDLEKPLCWKSPLNSIVQGIQAEKNKHTVPILLLAQTSSDNQKDRRNTQEKTDKKTHAGFVS